MCQNLRTRAPSASKYSKDHMSDTTFPKRIIYYESKHLTNMLQYLIKLHIIFFNLVTSLEYMDLKNLWCILDTGINRQEHFMMAFPYIL